MSDIYWDEFGTPWVKPTEKQKSFLKALFAVCNDHDIPKETCISLRTRADYSRAIQVLIARLKNAGINWRKECNRE